MLAIIIISITWFSFAIIDGITDAYYWHIAMNVNKFDYKKFNLHKWSVIKRGIVLFGITVYDYNFLLIIPFIIMFSFFHNGAYYEFRKKLSNKTIYKKGWFDQSTTSTSKWTFINTPLVRSILFIIGIILNIIYLLTFKTL